jgi:hypothetical protein
MTSPSGPLGNAGHRLRHRRAASRRTAWRGGPQHQISRVLKARDILPDDQTTGRHQVPVVTCNPGDLTRIADSIGVKIRLFPT